MNADVRVCLFADIDITDIVDLVDNVHVENVYVYGNTLIAIARDFSPRTEASLHHARVLIDVSGLERLLGPPSTIASELHRTMREASLHDCVIVIASTRAAAQLVASSMKGCLVIEPGHDTAAIAALPLATLTAFDAPPDLLITLERWGMRTLGDFAALPADALAARIGQDGLRWHALARGDDPRPLVPTIPDERFEAIVDLEWPIEGVEPLAFVLGRPLEQLCDRLEQRDRAVAAIELRLRLTVSRSWRMRRLELPTPMRDARMLRTLICLDLEGHLELLRDGDGHGGIDRLGLFIEPTEARIAQFSLLAPPSIAPEDAATLMARLGALMGQERCGIAQLIDTHRAGAIGLRQGSLGSQGSQGSQGSRSSQGALMRTRRGLRRLRHPIPARVVLEHGRPVRVTTDRRGWSGGHVTWCTGPWRASGDWFFDPYDWEEWDVSLSDGGSYCIHVDRERSQWFIDATID